MFEKKYSIQKELSSGVVLRLVEFMFYNLTNSFALTEIAERTDTSKSNVYRALKRLGNLDLLRVEGYHGRKLYGIDSKAELAFPIWNLLMSEKLMNLDKGLRSALNSMLGDISQEKIASVILYGNFTYSGKNLSELELCIVCEDKRERQRVETLCRRFHPEYKFKPYFMPEREFPSYDPIVLDSLINGIPLLGREYAFKLRVRMEHLPKEYLKYKVEIARRALEDSKKNPDGNYLKDLAINSLREVEEALSTRVRKRSRRSSVIAKWIDDLEGKVEEL